MARILGLEEVDGSLRTALQSTLRVCDEAVVLPGATRSEESGAFKNVCLRLSGSDTELSSELFSPNWFAGVSAVVVPAEAAEALLKNNARHAAALKKLADQIPTEMADSELQVGPELDGDPTDRDIKGWTQGFDSGSCCVGLYSARQSRAPEANLLGMNRVHSAYYLVCKAGGGVAAQTFHSRLLASLAKGKTLDECLEHEGGSPGPQALRRVSLAAQRNRQRILAQAALILGFAPRDTIPDTAAAPTAPHRGCIPTIDVTYNSLRKVDGCPRSTWQYSSGCVDATMSQGLMTSSNLAEGFVAFTSSSDEFRLSLRNEAYSTIPFVTKRLATARAIATVAADAHKAVQGRSEDAHPDAAFVKSRFSWKSKSLGSGPVVNVEPPGLWGSHQSENFLASWARELGVAVYKTVRMAPELVCIAAMEPAKYRAVVKRVLQDQKGPVSVS